MIGLVVTGHGHFADGIHTSAQMIAGENEYVRYINFEEGTTPEQLAEKFNAAAMALWFCPICPAALPSRLQWSASTHAPTRRSRSLPARICRCSLLRLRCWIWKMIPALLQKNWLTPARIVW